TSVTEVMNMEQDIIIMQEVFRYKQLGIDQNGRAYGQFEATGVRPTFINRLGSKGVKLPSNMFGERIRMGDLSGTAKPSRHCPGATEDLQSPGRGTGPCRRRGRATGQGRRDSNTNRADRPRRASSYEPDSDCHPGRRSGHRDGGVVVPGAPQ